MNIVEQIQNEILKLQAKIGAIQEKCSHPEECVTKTNHGSTGNYDNKDEYWTNFHCSLCDKRWSMEGSL